MWQTQRLTDVKDLDTELLYVTGLFVSHATAYC